MRLLSTLFASGTLALTATIASADVYNGNSGTGFGGPIGTGSIAVTSTATDIVFSLTTGVPFSGNALILYVDSLDGGHTSTASLTDVADGGRRAISGLSDNGRALVSFAAGFDADFAITVEPGVFSGTFSLANPSNFAFVQGNGLAGTGQGPFTFSVPKIALGLPATGAFAFDFVGTLISTSAYRSNETFGTSFTIPGSVGDTPNAGFTGTVTFNNALTYSVVPEPGSTVALFAGVGILATHRRRRTLLA